MYETYYEILNTLENLNPGGYGFIFLETSILNKKGTSNKIKEYLVENNYIDSIVTFTSSLVLNWPTKISMVILRKDHLFRGGKNLREVPILMVNATLDYKKNKDLRIKFLDQVHINDITKVVSQRKDFRKLSKKITIDDVKDNEYNLSPELYVVNKATPKKELSVKKMLEELRREKGQMNPIERKINNNKN